MIKSKWNDKQTVAFTDIPSYTYSPYDDTETTTVVKPYTLGKTPFTSILTCLLKVSNIVMVLMARIVRIHTLCLTYPSLLKLLHKNDSNTTTNAENSHNM